MTRLYSKSDIVKYSNFQTFHQIDTIELFDLSTPMQEPREENGCEAGILFEYDDNAYKRVSKEKKFHMLHIGQPTLKRLLSKIAKEGEGLAFVLKMLLDLQSSYIYMIRYMYSRKYAKRLTRKFCENVRKIMNASSIYDKIKIESYRLDNCIQFSHIILVEIIGVGKMTFGVDIEEEKPLYIRPTDIKSNPVDNYAVIETAIMKEYGNDVYRKFTEMAVKRKKDYDKCTSCNSLLSCYENNIENFLKRIEKIYVRCSVMSCCLPLSTLYQQRVSISQPRTLLNNYKIETDSEFVCISIRLDDMHLADRIIIDLHCKLSKYAWYLWSESNDLDSTCFVLCYRHKLTDENAEYDAFETMLLSRIALTLSDEMHCGLEYLLSDVISIETSYTPAYGPMLVNNSYGIELNTKVANIRTSKEYVSWLLDSGQLNLSVLEILGRNQLLTETYNDRSLNHLIVGDFDVESWLEDAMCTVEFSNNEKVVDRHEATENLFGEDQHLYQIESDNTCSLSISHYVNTNITLEKILDEFKEEEMQAEIVCSIDNEYDAMIGRELNYDADEMLFHIASKNKYIYSIVLLCYTHEILSGIYKHICVNAIYKYNIAFLFFYFFSPAHSPPIYELKLHNDIMRALLPFIVE